MQEISAQDLSHDILAGNKRALARLLRQIDDRNPNAQQVLSTLFKKYLSRLDRHHVIGITGSPGAGKSTVVNALISHFRSQGFTVGVIAVDPTSPFTGGAILGDRIRMQQHTLDPGVFIRSLATRGALGGLSRSTADCAYALAGFGFDRILIETVGVGQGEIDISRVAQTVVVVLTPGSGDDIQAIKAGILEIADVYLVNKADREGAPRVVSDLKAMLSLLPSTHTYQPLILESVAHRDQGIAELVQALANHHQFLLSQQSGQLREKNRREQAFIQLVRDELVIRGIAQLGDKLHEGARRVADGADPYEELSRLI